jgi:6-phosphofructokinase 1
MTRCNALYAQSGGVTAVINTTAAAIIATARQHSDRIGTVFAARNGVLGALREELFDTAQIDPEELERLAYTPGGVFGSCRFKLKDPETHRAEFQRLIDVCKAHDIGYIFYNGGNDSADTSHKISRIGDELGHPIQCIGVPKTVDNDLPITDNCPGFGSVAKYVAVSTLEASLDVMAMAESSTKVFILEVMGRHAGWIAAAAGVAKTDEDDPPHIILLPERRFDRGAFLSKVKQTVERVGYCTVVVSEGLQHPDGSFLADAGTVDAFGHKQLGGVAPQLANLVRSELGFKYHWALADYLQRSARHIASQADHDHAWAVGKAAVELALAGENAVMPIIERLQDDPYQWQIRSVPLAQMANKERMVPDTFISDDGMGVTDLARRYIQPLIAGEAYPPYRANGLPDYARLQLSLAPRLLEPFDL